MTVFDPGQFGRWFCCWNCWVWGRRSFCSNTARRGWCRNPRVSCSGRRLWVLLWVWAVGFWVARWLRVRRFRRRRTRIWWSFFWSTIRPWTFSPTPGAWTQFAPRCWRSYWSSCRTSWSWSCWTRWPPSALPPFWQSSAAPPGWTSPFCKQSWLSTALSTGNPSIWTLNHRISPSTSQSNFANSPLIRWNSANSTQSPSLFPQSRTPPSSA